jgi:hypothetical protein
MTIDRDYVTCESAATIVLHARPIGTTPINYSGHGTGYGGTGPRALCDVMISWDTKRSLSQVTCHDCKHALLAIIGQRYGGTIDGRLTPRQLNAREQLERLTMVWTKTDLACDDRAAELARIDQAIVAGPRPVPQAILEDREGAVKRLHDACAAEGEAREDLLEAARAYRREIEGR